VRFDEEGVPIQGIRGAYTTKNKKKSHIQNMRGRRIHNEEGCLYNEEGVPLQRRTTRRKIIYNE
jgi:hypothetical protein